MKDTQALNTPNIPELSGNFDKKLLKEAVRQLGTPLYVYELDRIAQRVNQLKAVFAGRKALICYALKVNSNLSIGKKLANLECCVDCVYLG